MGQMPITKTLQVFDAACCRRETKIVFSFPPFLKIWKVRWLRVNENFDSLNFKVRFYLYLICSHLKLVQKCLLEILT